MKQEEILKKLTIIIFQTILIGILVLVLISNYISLESRDVIVRDPQSIQESTIEYLPPPPPKFELGNIIKLARGLRKNFTPTMDQITDDYTALYINNTNQSNKLEDCIFWYKGKIPPNGWKFGSKDFWRFHNKRYDRQYKDPF